MDIKTMALATNIFMARKKARLSQKELAKRTGLSPNYISALETNGKKEPSIDTLSRIADATNTTIDELLFENLVTYKDCHDDKLIQLINAQVHSMSDEKIDFLIDFLKVKDRIK